MGVFHSHEEGVILQPESILFLENLERFRFFMTASLTGFSEKSLAAGVELTVIHFFSVTEIYRVTFLFCKKPL